MKEPRHKNSKSKVFHKKILSKSFHDNRLPQDVKRYIGDFLTKNQASEYLSLNVSDKLFLFTTDKKKLMARKGLLSVVHGCAFYLNMEQLKKMLIRYPHLMTIKLPVKDPGGRIFKDISMYQYAAWALDISMLNMMESCLNPDSSEVLGIINEQIKELKQGKVSYTLSRSKNGDNREIFSSHYDLTPLNNSMQQYFTYYYLLNTEERKDFWLKYIAQEQAQVPVHIAQELTLNDGFLNATSEQGPTRDIPYFIDKMVLYPMEPPSEYKMPWFDMQLEKSNWEMSKLIRRDLGEGMGSRFGIVLKNRRHSSYKNPYIATHSAYSNLSEDELPYLKQNQKKIESLQYYREKGFYQTEERLMLLHKSFSEKVTYYINSFIRHLGI